MTNKVTFYLWLIMLENIIGMANKLNATQSRLEKESILKEYGDKQGIKEFLKFHYNPLIVTGLSSKKIDKAVNGKWIDIVDNVTIVQMMEYLKENNTGRDHDICYVQGFIKSHEQETQEFLKKLFCKELTLGIDKTVNKVFPGLVPEFNVMLAKKFEDEINKITDGIIITKKLDGLRCVAIHDNQVNFFSRNGHPFEHMVDIEKEIKMLPSGYVYDGELIARKESSNVNDLFRQTASIGMSKGKKESLEFHIFDMIPLEEFLQGKSKNGAEFRKRKLEYLINSNNFNWIKNVEMLYDGNDLEQVQIWNDKAEELGWEGIMVNTLHGKYDCKRSSNLLKVKKFKTADVKVISAHRGTGRNEDKLGYITIEFEHKGKLWTCDVGSGFTDHEREMFESDTSETRSQSASKGEYIVGRIIEIQYFEISEDKSGKVSLRFPTFKRIRYDKDEISMY